MILWSTREGKWSLLTWKQIYSFVLTMMWCRVSKKFALKAQTAIPIAINTGIPLTLSAMRFLAPSSLLNFEKPPELIQTSELEWVASCSKLFTEASLSRSKKLP